MLRVSGNNQKQMIKNNRIRRRKVDGVILEG